mmetsp:Transcript_46928/g.97412  ORF Transcript_46928/g.97412 Transcript_46928/m.97412 type:complete len:318 (-) Transcript_46928:143-1096(-)
MAAHLAGGVLRPGLREELALLFDLGIRLAPFDGGLFPVLELVVHFQLALGKAGHGLDGPVHFVIRRDRLAVFVPAEGREGHDLLVPAQIDLLHAIDLRDTDRHVELLDLLGELLPGRREALAPDAPRGVHVDKGHVVFRQPLLEVVLVQLHRVDALLLVHLLQRLVVLLVPQLALLPVPPAEQPGRPVFRELPLLDVLGDVLAVRSEGVPDVDADVVAVDVQHGNVEIQPQLGLGVLVEGDGGDDFRSGKGRRFAEKENPHDAQGDEGHGGAERGGLRQILWHTTVKVYGGHRITGAAPTANIIAHRSCLVGFFFFR